MKALARLCICACSSELLLLANSTSTEIVCWSRVNNWFGILQAEDIQSKVKVLLKEGLGKVLQTEMELAYNDLW